MKPRLTLVTKDQLLPVPLTKVYYLQASGSYTNVFYTPSPNQVVGSKESRNLKSFLAELDERFICIHRSTVVNTDKVAKIFTRSREIQLKNLTDLRLVVSRSNWSKVKALFKPKRKK